MRIEMSGGLQDPRTHDIHHRRHDLSFNGDIPSRDPPPAVGNFGPPDPRARSIEAPIIVESATLNDKPKKTQNPLPLLSLKQVGDLVGIFNHGSDTHSHQRNSPRSDEPDRGSSASHSMLAKETVISQVKEIIGRDGSSLTDYLRGETAQTFVDAVHQALGLFNLLPRLQRKCLSALCRICGRLALLPRPLQVSVRYNRWSTPQYRGGYADVWRGECQGRSVAAKVMRVYSTSNFDKIRKRFCKEVITWNALSHPNVLPLLGMTMGSQEFVLVSEWMENGNINEFIKAHKDVDRFELLKDVARGLAYMHDQGMIHGDLKGANILIDQDGHARLSDFGLLTIVPDFTNPTSSSSFSIGGTTRWMSPELFCPDQASMRDTRLTKQSDCYALGMVIYEVLSGQAPFAPFNCYAVILMVTLGERPRRPDGPEGAWFTHDLWWMLNRCWATELQCRPNVGVVLECLERVSGDSEVPPRVDDNVGVDRDDLDVASGSPGELSWFDPRHLVAFLYGILCLSRLRAITRKVLASRRGRTGPERPQPTTPMQDRL